MLRMLVMMLLHLRLGLRLDVARTRTTPRILSQRRHILLRTLHLRLNLVENLLLLLLLLLRGRSPISTNTANTDTDIVNADADTRT